MIVYISSVSQYTLQHIILGRTNLTDLVASMAYAPCVVVSPTPTPPLPGLKSVPTSKHELTKRDSNIVLKTVTDYSLTSPSAAPSMQPYIEYETAVQASRGKANIVTILPIIGVLLSAVSAWSVFTPSITKTTTNVVTFPTTTPLPPGGVVGSSTTVNSKVSNAAQFGAIGTGVLGSGLTYDTSAYSIQTSDLQGVFAADDLVAGFLGTLKCPWGDATPSPPPQPPLKFQLEKDARTPACLNVLRGGEVYLDQTKDWNLPPSSNPHPPPQLTGSLRCQRHHSTYSPCASNRNSNATRSPGEGPAPSRRCSRVASRHCAIDPWPSNG